MKYRISLVFVADTPKTKEELVKELEIEAPEMTILGFEQVAIEDFEYNDVEL